ncbi:MAG: hypothetical protein ACTHJ6_09510 [Oryzihumus sp.]
MRGTMGQQGIEVTGNHEIDQAAAEIAGHVRDGRVGSHVRYSDQDHYDTAQDLRDRILKGAHYRVIRELAQNYSEGVLSAESAMDAIASAVLA